MLADQGQRGLSARGLQHGEARALQDAALDVARPVAIVHVKDQRALGVDGRGQDVHGELSDVAYRKVQRGAFARGSGQGSSA